MVYGKNHFKIKRVLLSYLLEAAQPMKEREREVFF